VTGADIGAGAAAGVEAVTVGAVTVEVLAGVWAYQQVAVHHKYLL